MKRTYRAFMKRRGLFSFRVSHKETDLFIQAPEDISRQVSGWIIEARTSIEAYAASHGGFIESFTPLPDDPLAPPPVNRMLRAGIAAGTGPMAAVAGAIAQFVCQKAAALLPDGEIIVENGGDTCFRISGAVTAAIWAGRSPFTGKVGIRCAGNRTDAGDFLSICTSSGTVGHSRSFGTADAVTVVSKDAALADAVATAVGNMVRSRKDVSVAVERLRDFEGILGGVVIKADQIGAWGEIELVPL